MTSLLDTLRDAAHTLPVGRLAAIVAVLVAAVVVSRVVRGLLRRAYWRRVEAASALEREEQLHRAKRQQTALTLSESAARYAIYGGAAVVCLGFVSNDASNAIFTAGVGVVLVGFALQRVLGDIIAGVLLLFEGRYAVGDFIAFHGQNAAAGVVEEVGIRSTTLRTLGGDTVTVLNGSIVSFTRFAGGYRQYRIEFVAEGDGVLDTVGAFVSGAGAAPVGGYLVGPEVVEVLQLDAGASRIALRAVVPPSLSNLCDTVLPAQIEAALGDALRGPVVVVDLDADVWDAYRASLLLPAGG